MTPEQMAYRIRILEERLNAYEKSDRFIFEKHIQMLSGRNLQLGVGTGTKIGTSTSQKLGFFGATPLAGNSAALGIPAPYTAGDIGTALINLGLLYQT